MSVHKAIIGVVGSELHGLSSWIGETKKLWIKVDVDPRSIPLATIKSHIIDAQFNEVGSVRPSSDHFYAFCFMEK